MCIRRALRAAVVSVGLIASIERQIAIALLTGAVRVTPTRTVKGTPAQVLSAVDAILPRDEARPAAGRVLLDALTRPPRLP